MASIEDQRQTDRVATHTRARVLNSAVATGLDRTTPHASTRYLAADDGIMETYYYGHQSILIGRRSRYSCSIHVLST